MREHPLFFVGTYSRGEGDLFTLRLDPDRAALSPGPVYTGLESPSFLARDGRCLYAVSEREDGGAVASFTAAPDGVLTRTALIDAPYPSLCHACVWPDRTAVSFASYSGGGALTCSLNANGSLGAITQWLPNEGRGVNPARQGKPHVHSLTADPTGRFIIEADLGIDRLRVFRPEGLKLAPHAEVAVPAGDGPRHLAFHPCGRYAYLVTELTCHVIVFDWDASSGTLAARQRVALLDGEPGSCSAADIHLTPDGDYLYASVRGIGDLVRFAVHTDGSLGGRTAVPCGAKAVRNFAIDPAGRFLLVADQRADEVRLFSLESGLPGECLSVVRIPSPVCVLAAGKPGAVCAQRPGPLNGVSARFSLP
jgi:6-phosphogluconolactonase